MSPALRPPRSRRRAIAAAATLAALSAAAPAATAAPARAAAPAPTAAAVSGVVVARDAARGTLVTAAPGGAVRTLRTSGAARVRVGERISARASARADGTFEAAGRIVRRGTAAQARVRATVVKRDAGGYLLSAGSSTFAIRAGDARAARTGRPATARTGTATPSSPRVGDLVVARLRLGGGAPLETSLRTIDETRVLELEGILTEIADGTLRIAVARHGLVTVAVPAGLTVGARVGDEVEALVSVADDDTLTLVALTTDEEDDAPPAPDTPGAPGGDDDDDRGLDFDVEEGEVELVGVLGALSDSELTVAADATTSLTCSIPAGTPVTGVAVGDLVELECRLLDGGGFALLSIEAEDRASAPDGDDDAPRSDDDADEDDDEDEDDD